MNIEERLTRLNAYLRTFSPPKHIRAVTIPNDDGTFDIYINDSLPPCAQINALDHELNHIEKEHFYNDVAEINVLEAEADLVFAVVM